MVINFSLHAVLQIMALCKGKRAVHLESDIAVQEEGLSSESVTNVYSCNSGPSLDDDCSDTSLKLG